MRNLAAASAALLMTGLASLPASAMPAPARAIAAESEPAAAEREFTSLDAIDRVRTEGCSIDNFDRFLEWYVSSTTSGGWLEQVVWTNYLVHVGKLADPADAGNWVDRQDYLGQFRITSFDYRMSREANTLPESEYRRVALTRLGEKQYRVDWRGGPGFAGVEGADQNAQVGAYLFEYKKDCWYLTSDLR